MDHAEDSEAEAQVSNVFDRTHDETVPVIVEINGERQVVGQATLWQSDENLVRVMMDLKTDDVNDVKKLFSEGITGVSIAENDVTPEATVAPADGVLRFNAINQAADDPAQPWNHSHKAVQHGDGKPPWCDTCGLTGGYLSPTPRMPGGTHD